MGDWPSQLHQPGGDHWEEGLKQAKITAKKAATNRVPWCSTVDAFCSTRTNYFLPRPRWPCYFVVAHDRTPVAPPPSPPPPSTPLTLPKNKNRRAEQFWPHKEFVLLEYISLNIPRLSNHSPIVSTPHCTHANKYFMWLHCFNRIIHFSFLLKLLLSISLAPWNIVKLN